MKETTITNFSTLHDLLCNSYRNKFWIFRGQSNIAWSLLPKIGRKEFVDYSDISDSSMFEAWCRRAVAFIELPDNQWNRYAIAQHYGLATRLLDWTFNPLVAVFFAVSENSDNDSCIFCLQVDSVSHEIDPDNDSIYTLDYLGIFYPSAFVNRIIGQWGLFTYHPLPKNTLDTHDNGIILEKIIIPKDMKTDFLFDLNYYGINHTSLFPDLEGLSKYLNWWSGNNNWRKAFFDK